MPQDHHRSSQPTNERRHRGPYRPEGRSPQLGALDPLIDDDDHGDAARSSGVRGRRQPDGQHRPWGAQHRGSNPSLAPEQEHHQGGAWHQRQPPPPPPPPQAPPRAPVSRASVGVFLAEAAEGALRQVLEDDQEDSGGSYRGDEEPSDRRSRRGGYGNNLGEMSESYHNGGEQDVDEGVGYGDHSSVLHRQMSRTPRATARRTSASPGSWGGQGSQGLGGSAQNLRLDGFDAGLSNISAAYPDPRRDQYDSSRHSSGEELAAVGTPETVEELRRVRQSQTEIIYMLQDKLREAQRSLQEAERGLRSARSDNRRLSEANASLADEVRQLREAASFRIETTARRRGRRPFEGLGSGDEGSRSSTEHRDEEEGNEGQHGLDQYRLAGNQELPRSNNRHNNTTPAVNAAAAAAVPRNSDCNRGRAVFPAAVSGGEGPAPSAVAAEAPRNPDSPREVGISAGTRRDVPHQRGDPTPRSILSPSIASPATSSQERPPSHKRHRVVHQSPSSSGNGGEEEQLQQQESRRILREVTDLNQSNASYDDTYYFVNSMSNSDLDPGDGRDQRDESRLSADAHPSRLSAQSPCHYGSGDQKAEGSRIVGKPPARKAPPPSAHHQQTKQGNPSSAAVAVAARTAAPIPITHTSGGVLATVAMPVGARSFASASPSVVAFTPERSPDLTRRPPMPHGHPSDATVRKRRRQPQAARDGSKNSSCLMELFSGCSDAGLSGPDATANATEESTTAVVEGSDSEAIVDEEHVEQQGRGDEPKKRRKRRRNPSSGE